MLLSEFSVIFDYVAILMIWKHFTPREGDSKNALTIDNLELKIYQVQSIGIEKDLTKVIYVNSLW